MALSMTVNGLMNTLLDSAGAVLIDHSKEQIKEDVQD